MQLTQQLKYLFSRGESHYQMDTSGTVTIVPVIVIIVVFVAAALALFIHLVGGLYILAKTHISYNCSLSVIPKKWPFARHGGSEAVGFEGYPTTTTTTSGGSAAEVSGTFLRNAHTVHAPWLILWKRVAGGATDQKGTT